MGIVRRLVGYDHQRDRKRSKIHNLATRVLLILLCLMVACEGKSEYVDTSSVRSNSFKYVSSPDSRGTLNIFWSCMFTLVACTWTIQHLNIPEQRDRKREKGFWADVKWTWKGFWRQFKWMIFTMLAPEFILGKALGDLVSAMYWRDKMKHWAKNDNVEWSLAHGFYANMGGFVGVSEGDTEPLQVEPLSAPMIFWLRTNERSSTDGSEVGIEEGREGSDAGSEDGVERGPEESQNKRKAKIEKLPDITTAEIHDKSKSNIFVKSVAVIQVFWVILQVAVRAAKGLTISQLELVVCAFSGCSIITYFLLIKKPQGVQVPTRPIMCEPGSIDTAKEIGNLMWLRFLFMPFPKIAIDRGSGQEPNPYFHWPKGIPDDCIDLTFAEGDPVEVNPAFPAFLLGFIVGGVMFGGVHVAGWNLTFPTEIEQKLWRISSILLTVLSPVIFLPLIIHICSQRMRRNVPPILWQAWDVVFLLVYMVNRLYMLVEIFRTLFYLPPDAYITTWASNVPHVV